MSAILKALRKIESQSTKQASDLSPPKKFDAKRAMNQRIRRTWLVHRMTTLLGLILVLSAGVVIGLRHMSFAPIAPASAPAVPKISEEKTPLFLPLDSEKLGKEKPGPADGKRAIPELDMAAEPEAARLNAPKVPATVLKEDLKERTSQRRIEPPRPRVERAPHDSAGPVLELQAIVWSHDPESCFAVINGHIVRANGMVEGVSVTGISQDAVTLKQGEKVWKMRMLE